MNGTSRPDSDLEALVEFEPAHSEGPELLLIFGQFMRVGAALARDDYLASRNSLAEKPARFRMAWSVPSGMSPLWCGTTVLLCVRGLYQISWLPLARLSNSNPNMLRRYAISP
jgi:hypothetical protein